MILKDILSIMGHTAIIYVALMILLRIFGKKGLGQLTLTDLLFVLLITEGLGDGMRLGNMTLGGALVAAVTLIILDKIIDELLYRFPKFRRFVDGTPVVLIRKGKPDKKQMHRHRITIDDLEEAIREQGKAYISDIELAILEVDGKISVLENSKIEVKTPIEGLNDENK